MDPLAEELAYVNADHADSLLAYAHHYAQLRAAKSARMTGVSTAGFTLEVTMAGGGVKDDVLVAYDPPLRESAQLRKIAVAMHFSA